MQSSIQSWLQMHPDVPIMGTLISLTFENSFHVSWLHFISETELCPSEIPSVYLFIVFPLLFDFCSGFHSTARNSSIRILSLFGFMGIAENQKSLSSKFCVDIKCIPAWIYCQPQRTSSNLNMFSWCQEMINWKETTGEVWNTLLSESLHYPSSNDFYSPEEQWVCIPILVHLHYKRSLFNAHQRGIPAQNQHGFF